MLTAWIDEKLLGDSLSDFRTQFLGEVKTIEGKSLRPFCWHHVEPRHVFGLSSFLVFLASVQILVITEQERIDYNRGSHSLPNLLAYTNKPVILFGDTARHAIQTFNFAHIEIYS